MDTLLQSMQAILDKLAGIEARLDRIEGSRPRQEWYTTAEVAKELGRSPWSIRYGCEQGEIKAQKKLVGRKERWLVPAHELDRLRNHS